MSSKFIRKLSNFVNTHYISLSNVLYGKKCNFSHHCELRNTKIGNYTSIGRYSKIANTEIGNFCSISWNSSIGVPSHPMDRITSSAFTYRKLFEFVENDKNFQIKKTCIGNDVWIGCNVTILAGVKIGNGSIIGAGAVVTHDVEPYSIVAGVPAKLIRYRFEKDTIEKLNQICWWNWDDDTIKSNLNIFEKKLNEKTLNELFAIYNKLQKESDVINDKKSNI